MTMPSRIVWRSSQPSSGLSRSRNAMYIVRKPDSQRGPQLARSA